MTELVLGLTGPAGAGKSTVARAVLAELGGGSILHAGFALKAMLRAFYAALHVAPDLIERRSTATLSARPVPFSAAARRPSRSRPSGPNGGAT